ncbi:lipoprotein (plasmid) [Borreliella chilensis]|uniref:Lipoprotein n=1 Tax=Borreliella chilensis TaxID=1245910 RepID=A0A0A7UZ95_9SPIR|nr:lipoprotein [Borreliella chilensis]
MVKKVILISLGALILSCDLLFENEKQKTTNTKNVVGTIPVSIQSIEIRESNQNPTSFEKYYSQTYPIKTLAIDFNINRENEFQKAEDKILSTKGKVESLSILIRKQLLDSKGLTLKNLKEIKNIENLFQKQELLFIFNIKKNKKNIINIMLNPPNDTQKPKNYALLDLKNLIKNNVSEKYLNPIYRFQIKNKKDYHSIDYNKVSISENSIELDLAPHNQIFKMSKNFAQILEILTDINKLRLVIQKEYI